MKNEVETKIVSNEVHQKRIRNVAGTLAIEGITLSEASRRNLDRYANGQVDYQQIISELKEKYQRTKQE